MKISSPSLFKPTTLTMFSGFAIIIATTIALGSMAQDQSGHAAAIVSKSFRTELGSRNEDVGVISVNDEMPQHQSPAPRQLPSLINRPFAEVKLNVDPQQDFSNLQSELERIVGKIEFDRPTQEIRFDIQHNHTSPSGSQIHQICDLLTTVESALSQTGFKRYEKLLAGLFRELTRLEISEIKPWDRNPRKNAAPTRRNPRRRKTASGIRQDSVEPAEVDESRSPGTTV